MKRRQRSKTVTELESGPDTAAPSATPEDSRGEATPEPTGPLEPDPLYGVALLKMAFELKRRQDGTPDEILRGVLARMRLPEGEFRLWLSQQGELAKVFSGGFNGEP